MKLFEINLRTLSDMLSARRVKYILAENSDETRLKFNKWLNEVVKCTIKIDNCDESESLPENKE